MPNEQENPMETAEDHEAHYRHKRELAKAVRLNGGSKKKAKKKAKKSG